MIWGGYPPLLALNFEYMKLKIKVAKEILGFKYYSYIKVEFEKAKIIDIINFFNEVKEKDFDLSKWVLNFLNKHGKVRKSQRESVYYQSWIIFEQIKKYYFTGLFKDSKWKSDNTPIISLVTFIAKESCISALDILYKMTYEEFELIVEWVLWNLNETTKKWKHKNRLKAIYDKTKERTKEDEEKIKEKLKWLQEYQDKQHEEAKKKIAKQKKLINK